MKSGRISLIFGATFLFIATLACITSPDQLPESASAIEETEVAEPASTKTRKPTSTPQPETEVPPAFTPKLSNTPLPTETQGPLPTDTPEQMSYVRIVPSSINVRSGPGSDNDVIGYLYQDETIQIIDTNTDQSWLQVELSDGSTGWIGSSLVEYSESTKEVAGEDQDSEEDAPVELNAEDIFAGKTRFNGVGTDVLSDPDDIMSRILSANIDNIVPNSVLYR